MAIDIREEMIYEITTQLTEKGYTPIEIDEFIKIHEDFIKDTLHVLGNKFDTIIGESASEIIEE